MFGKKVATAQSASNDAFSMFDVALNSLKHSNEIANESINEINDEIQELNNEKTELNSLVLKNSKLESKLESFLSDED